MNTPPTSAWTELPQGQDVDMSPGNFYAAIASVSTDYDDAKVRSAATDRGLLIFDWGEQGDPGRATLGTDPDSSHRYVAAIVKATKDVTIPWAPSFLWVHPFHLVKAWQAPAGAPGAPAPPGPTPAHGAPAPAPARRIGAGKVVLACLGAGAVLLIARGRRGA